MNKKLLLSASCAILLAGCGDKAAEKGKDSKNEKVTIMLDWTPNTNHTGLYVAQKKGYFKKQGLDVEIKTPGEVTADQLIAANKKDVQFGISAQETVTQSRSEGIPVKSIGAIIQHNTSGFMSLKEKNIQSPKDYVGKTYGGWGAPIEKPMIDAVMKKDFASVNDTKIINMGNTDFFTASKKNIDFAWVYYGWTGIEAKTRNIDVNMQYIIDYDKNLDYYTPVVIANEQYLKSNKETAKKFMTALKEGYEYSIKHDKESADILMEAVPELKKQEKLVYASQKYLSPKYQDDAKYWGYQQERIWKNFGQFMKDNKVITKDFVAKDAFTNEFVEEK
ncbi:ABC transporter substrate-binding protein [Macrococcus armenti]|uniref:ABC transporter substrate-binding protein n=1 Tax=Macrococcus armenti TaxID=2875764 RepID=UPI001CCA5017|nr:ABC transporter substrate-binding protein [Macrococcus armenti]UBH09591.1 ABC transporter substrate-binding protein [Macrococcus armenti]UBH11867.1 ABC transporter substrate-binding protein [Macrococcus armenti]UBH16342.1 ABC transporter substrate-binding protein [Macrococcus armenti]UBH18699.1 ABC transporter substrate-binding protein [Macrococcus armenti]UBH20970.1 ABC transporter substrate-binding protein [Macrococcus armenti]